MMHHAFSRRQFLKAGGAAALSTAAAGLLSSCGGSSAGGTAATGDSTTYTVLYARQPASLNYLICSADPDLYLHPLRGHAGGVRQPRQDP